MPFWVDFGAFWRPILAAFGSLLEPMLAFGDLSHPAAEILDILGSGGWLAGGWVAGVGANATH